ncbi:methionyl-tRNA formyltransferase [Aquimarina litoralis]|uniref:methionyl-tRNA formyltransferase n=1 Tax=Aquimarina litoralis TaxID=584605 RepID=UPI001C56F62C|nr:formyltransferase family protein [Aquimarina litoralis]MBW1298286.1 hypothetical protein [Aquimarina litoralis]
MKTVLIGSFPTCLTVYKFLAEQDYLSAVCFQKSLVPQPEKDFWFTSIQKEDHRTFLINQENIKTQFIQWLNDIKPDLILVCGLSIKIPKEALCIPKFGFLNIHFGKLPINRGPDPLFWSIKQGQKQTAITIHQMDEDWDTGNILIEHPVSLIPGETLGMMNSKMSYMLENLTKTALELIVDSKNLKPQSKTNVCYYKKPTDKDITICWESQTADEIEQLINACNPKYGGATTYYQGSPIKLIEVSPVDTQTLLGKTAGEIIHAHPQEGLFVYCKYGKVLRINMISSDAGILSGSKYVHLGIRTGHCFTTTLQPKQQIIF